MARQLNLFSETEFEHRVPEGLPLSCPTLDLSATWEGEGKNVFIHRPPGQVVSRIHQLPPPGGKAPNAVAATWKADGQFLAVAWSDGIVRLMGLENNKAAHHIEICPNQSDVKVAHIGWAINNIVDRSCSLLPSQLEDGASEILGDIGGSKVPDLPRELTFLEIETALPKISALPSASAGPGEDAMVFTLRTGIDFLFPILNREEYDRVNVMIVGTTDGQIHLSIYDSFIIGSFTLPSLGSGSTTSQLLRMASNPQVTTHALLLAETATRPDEIYILPMDIPFISSNPINLPLLASKLTTLQKLLRYIRQTQLHMQVEWKNTRELPSKFLGSVQGDLETLESGPRDVVSALYHTVVTGHVYEPLREWLVDILAERGHKRWDKAVTSGLENLRGLIHENFLPALERTTIILSRLRGLAQFHNDREDIGFTVIQINRVMDIVECMTLLGHKALLVVMDELDNFASFSTWLRFQIDRLNASSTEKMELTEKEATLDVGKILTYIEKYLTNSPLGMYFDAVDKEARDQEWTQIKDVPRLLDLLDSQLKKREAGQESMKALPQVEFFVDLAAFWISDILNAIARAKKRSVRLGKPVRLSVQAKVDYYDIRLCQTTSKSAAIYAAVASRDNASSVTIFRVALEIINGISSNLPAEACTLNLVDMKLIDLRFMGDQTIVMLCSSNSDHSTKVILVPITSAELKFSPMDGQVETISSESFKWYGLPGERPLKPIRMEARDAANIRSELPARICLLGSNRTTWQTFTFPEDRDATT